MDIEGEEYNLIPYLHKKGMLNNVSNLFIEWHYNKIKNISKEAHLNSVKLIKNIKTYNWDALNYSFKDTNSKYNTYMKNYTLHTDADKWDDVEALLADTIIHLRQSKCWFNMPTGMVGGLYLFVQHNQLEQYDLFSNWVNLLKTVTP